MARINASLADVSTDFTPVDPGTYVFEIEDVKEKEDSGRQSVQIKNKIVEVVEGNAEMHGKTFNDFIFVHKRDGSVNQFALVQIKRYFEAVLGKEEVAARGDDLDTDELKNGRWRGELKITSYTPEPTAENPTPKTTMRNEVAAIGPAYGAASAASAPTPGRRGK